MPRPTGESPQRPWLREAVRRPKASDMVAAATPIWVHRVAPLLTFDEEISMLTIRGADQVCTSLRAAQKSLSDGGATPRPRLDELDLMIGELAVGTPGYRGDGVRTKAQIEAFVSLLTKASGSVGDAGKSGELPGIEDAVSSASRPATVTDALGHFRRALATLARFAKTEDSFPP